MIQSLSREEPSLIIENTEQWQQTSKSNNTINGYYRKGTDKSNRIHLLHGNGFSAMTLAAMTSQLPTKSNIWLTDIPGHGLSTQPTKAMPNWNQLADTIADAIYKQANVEKDGPLIGVGHSMGAILTLLSAVKHPDLFSEIILLDPVLFKSEMIIVQHLMKITGTWRKRSMVKSVSNRTFEWENIEAMKHNIASKPFYKSWHPQVISDYCHSGSSVSSEGTVRLSCSPQWEASIFGSCPTKLWHAIKKINIPVNMLVAKNTYFFIPSAVKRAAKINKHIRWQEFGERHCFPMEQPIETAEILTKIIAKNN